MNALNNYVLCLLCFLVKSSPIIFGIMFDNKMKNSSIIMIIFLTTIIKLHPIPQSLTPTYKAKDSFEHVDELGYND